MTADKIDMLDTLRVRILVEDTVMYESPFWGAHGISFYITARKDDIVRNILIDVGQSPEVLFHNMELMEINPASIDAIVLTHCHYDHTQGLSEVLKKIGRSGIPVVAHPSIFRLNFIDKPYLRHVGIMPNDAKSNLEKLGAILFLTADPLQLMPGLITTGSVPRQTDFEEVGIPLKTIDSSNHVVQDIMEDDISVIAAVKGRGLVILTGCSHAGIVNITKHAIALTGISKVAAIIGGLHLIEAPMERITKTVDALYSMGVESVYGGHCTGFDAQVEFRKKFGTRFKPLHTGDSLEFP